MQIFLQLSYFEFRLLKSFELTCKHVTLVQVSYGEVISMNLQLLTIKHKLM